MIRGSLVSLIYVHTLNVSQSSAGDAALTLIGPDVIAIMRAFETLHEIWANPIEIALAIWLLARETGPGCVGPAVAVIGERLHANSFLVCRESAMLMIQSMHRCHVKTVQLHGPSYEGLE